MKTKSIILVGDGMADFPIPELGNRTPLEYASTPHMDSIAINGCTGLVQTVPDGYPVGSDVANLSLLGYDPVSYYSGRAPYEAASLGIKLSSNSIAFRCNFVTITNGVMADYSAGHITTEEATALIELLKSRLDTDEICFYPGVSYRHILVIKGVSSQMRCTPPHDITDLEFGNYLPQGAGSDILLTIMEQAHSLLNNCSVNNKRIALGKSPATDIWLWGQGKQISLPSIKERFDLTGSVISAVDLIRGLGIEAGLSVRLVPGATGYLDTNYRGKVDAAQAALENEDFVYLHVEAPDETSHQGSLSKKIQAIEDFDKQIVGEVIRLSEQQKNLRILVTPDHATPVSLKTHHKGAVPYCAIGPGVQRNGASCYGESAVATSAVITGSVLFEKFVKGNL